MMMGPLKLSRIFQWLFVTSCFICLGVRATDQTLVSASDFNGNSGSKRVDPYDAFANNINSCLFNKWTTASGSKKAVLSGPVSCKGIGGTAKQLCYGIQQVSPAQFAVCYNTDTLTPDFTGHVVSPVQGGGGREARWRTDEGKFAPNPQATIDDYNSFNQKDLYDNFDIKKQFFCAKGHLTPNADFAKDDERALTMITTNIAPQWQNFNSRNWAGLEKAVRTYAKNNNREVYVFTGVGGQARTLQGDVIKLNGRVVAPRWYWKAVCDPVAQQSIVFAGENPIGIAAETKVAGCNGMKQTKTYGVVYCSSLDSARTKYPDFKLPPFNSNCKPSDEGTFMDNELRSAFL